MFTECSTPRTAIPEALTPRVLHSGKDTGRSDIDGTETTHPRYRTESAQNGRAPEPARSDKTPARRLPKAFTRRFPPCPSQEGCFSILGAPSQGVWCWLPRSWSQCASMGGLGGFCPVPHENHGRNDATTTTRLKIPCRFWAYTNSPKKRRCFVGQIFNRGVDKLPKV